MRYEVRQDRITRVIEVHVEQGSVPDLDVTEPWNRRQHIIRPNQVRIVIEAGRIAVTVAGLRVLRDNKVSSTGQGGSRTYRTSASAFDALLSEAPEWARELLNELEVWG